MLRDSPIRQIMLLRHDYVHRIGRKVAMLLRIWRFAAIYLTAPTLSLTFCHSLEMPRKMRYGEGLYMAVQHSLYRYFASVGAFAELGAAACLVVLFILLRNGRAVFHLTLAATLCIAAGLGVWFAVVSLANAQMAQWNSLPLPANWTDGRRKWECGHAASAAVDLLGFGALMLAVVVDTPRSASHAGAASESRRYDSA